MADDKITADCTVDYTPSPLDEALAEYFRRRDGGERVDPTAFCEEHPAVAEGLRAYLSDAGVLERAVDADRPGDETTDYAPLHDPRGRPPAGTLVVRCPHCGAPQSVAVDSSLVGLRCAACDSTYSLAGGSEHTHGAPAVSTVGHFELLERLGVGGFGSVWKARDTKLDRTVAVKIPRRGDMDAAEVDKFLREARAAAQLRHPGIVAVHEVGRDGDTVYIVSDLVRGLGLDDWLTGQKPTLTEAATLCERIADALQHAHDQGVVHRDLKPGNVLIDGDGAPHLVDFGLARREVGEVTMTVEGQILGTPAYMSPEQAQGESHRADRRSDVYSLGVVLFELLTGELPFRGNVRMLLHQIVNDEPPSPRKLNSRVPPDLETITLRCLEKEPEKRFPSAAEVRDDLRRYHQGKPILARPVSTIERAVRWAKRNPTMTTAASLVVFLAVAGPLVAFRLAQLQWSLQERFNETAGLIEQKTELTQRAARRTKELETELAVWTGKANPWDFWPPSREDPLRADLARELLAHTQQLSGQRSTAEATRDPLDATLESLAIARLADALGRTGRAVQSYEESLGWLETLSKDPGADLTLAKVRADCHLRLSQLMTDSDRHAAERHVEAARSIHEEVVGAAPRSAAARVDLLESTWASKRFGGFGSGLEAFGPIAEIKQQLAVLWPEDPRTLYRTACHLTGTPPTLLAQSIESATAGRSPARSGAEVKD